MKLKPKKVSYWTGVTVLATLALVVLFELLPLNVYREYETTRRDPDGVLVLERHYSHLHRVGLWNRYDVGEVYDSRVLDGQRIEGRFRTLVARFP